MGKKKTPMTREAARRIQKHADKTGTNQKFKEDAMSAAYKNEPLEGQPAQGGSGEGESSNG